MSWLENPCQISVLLYVCFAETVVEYDRVLHSQLVRLPPQKSINAPLNIILKALSLCSFCLKPNGGKTTSLSLRVSFYHSMFSPLTPNNQISLSGRFLKPKFLCHSLGSRFSPEPRRVSLGSLIRGGRQRRFL